MDEPKPDTPETLLLLRRFEAGDPDALAELMARHRDEMRQFVARRLDGELRARIDPSDVVQEAQMDICRRLMDFLARQPMPFHLWLRKTAYEHLLMLRRRHVEATRRATGCESPLPDPSVLLLARQLLAGGSTPSQSLHRRELARRVRQAVAQLTEADREILFMRNYEGFSYQEVGCLLGIENNTARQRYGRALIRLHQLLAEGGLTESQV
jgi:RNA polymerase sigma-70 factor (ECF subfamily)